MAELCCDFETTIREGSWTLTILPGHSVDFPLERKPPKRKTAPPMAEPFWKRFEKKRHAGKTLNGKRSRWHHTGGA